MPDRTPVLPTAYTPTDYEQKIYRLWEQGDYFRGVIDPDKEPYCISMPPPNITGVLHLGHATAGTLEDALIRFERMRGKAALFLPGTDHAAIATQVVVEEKIAKEEGKTRHDLGREEFLKRVRAFVKTTKSRIDTQQRRLGLSADWSRERYTLDEPMTRAVNEAFVRLYNDGLIYRGQRIVHWDAKLHTTVSDEEIEYTQESAPLYTLQYGPFQITTARPETKFGDKYVVVHPDDKRYGEYEDGDTVTAEWINGPVTATIIKDKAIDPTFGTGVMTITPWHDAVDFAIAERHELDREQIIDFDGRLLPIAGEFAGMTIKEARPKIVEKLKMKALLVKTDTGYTHNIAVNSRGGNVIEPQIMQQWFVKVAPLAKKALKAVKSGKIEIVPPQFTKVYYQWMENLHDWNISRQIWWGHRIPVFTCNKCAHQFVSVEPAQECPKCKGGLTQDPDTLDTWFSSGLWTFATLGWPNKTRDLEFWHPTAVLETGRDILFFWVSRMIMLSLYLVGEVPFKKVYLHGLVLDTDGQKMSKSKGNGIDPLEMADKYGMDAVRLSLVIGISPGQDTRLSPQKIARQRNVINKLWNIARFVSTTTECKRTCSRLEEIQLGQLAIEDQWILHRLAEVTEQATRGLEEFRFSDATQTVLDFTWNDFADWYLEIAKFTAKQATPKARAAKNDILLAVLEQILTLLHPILPFVTEVLWQELKKADPDTARRPDLIVAPWPSSSNTLRNKKSADQFEQLRTLVRGLRAIRADYRIANATTLQVTLSGAHSLTGDPALTTLLQALARVTVSDGSAKDKNTKEVKRTFGPIVVTAHIQAHADVHKEHARLNKELSKASVALRALEGRLASKTFTKKAPAAVVEQERERKKTLKRKVQELSRLVDEMGRLQ
ncbi:MAG: valine--tRNA ligase [Candidatus Andersenbacteria bacterium]